MKALSSPAITVPVSSLLPSSLDKFGPLKTKTLFDEILNLSIKTSVMSLPEFLSNPLTQLINFPS